MSRHRRLIELISLTLALIVFAFLLYQGYLKYLRTCYPNRYEEQVLSCAEKYHLSPSLLMAVIYTESGFDADALSSAGAVGLMQLTETTFDWAQMRRKIPEDQRLDLEQLYDPTVNILYGSFVLSLLREEFSQEDTVLAAYNAGIGNVQKWLRDDRYSEDGFLLKAIPFTETRNYVDRVRAAQEMYQKLYHYA